MELDYSRFICVGIDGAITLNEVNTEATREDGIYRIKTEIGELNSQYHLATVITIDGFRIPLCSKGIGQKWELCLGLRLREGEGDLTAEEFLLKDKKMRLAHFGGDQDGRT